MVYFNQMKARLKGLRGKDSILRVVALVVIAFVVFLAFQIKHNIDVKNGNQSQQEKQKKRAAATRKYYDQQLSSTKNPRLQAEYHADIAQSYEDLKQWDNAIKELKQAVAIYDKGYSYYNEIADDYAQLGDKANALSYYDQALASAKRAGPSVVDASKFAEYINTKKQQVEGKAPTAPAKKQGIPG